MRARLTIAGLVVVVLGAGWLGGCVPTSRYNEAVAANARAQEQLSETAAELERLRAQQDRLLAEAQSAGPGVAARDRLIANLRDTNQSLEAQLAALNRRVAALDQPIQVPDIGPLVLLPAELDRQLLAWAQRYSDLVEYDRAKGMIKFTTDLLFARGSDEVSDEARQTLERLAEIIRGAEAERFNVYIAGHTDDVPIRRAETLRRHPSNLYLSVHRAVSVAQQLMDSGVNPAKLGVLGFGEYHPVAANAAGGRGNPLNRRVEIWIVPPDQFLSTDVAAGPRQAPAAPRSADVPAPAMQK